MGRATPTTGMNGRGRAPNWGLRRIIDSKLIAACALFISSTGTLDLNQDPFKLGAAMARRAPQQTVAVCQPRATADWANTAFRHRLHSISPGSVPKVVHAHAPLPRCRRPVHVVPSVAAPWRRASRHFCPTPVQTIWHGHCLVSTTTRQGHATPPCNGARKGRKDEGVPTCGFELTSKQHRVDAFFVFRIA